MHYSKLPAISPSSTVRSLMVPVIMVLRQMWRSKTERFSKSADDKISSQPKQLTPKEWSWPQVFIDVTHPPGRGWRQRPGGKSFIAWRRYYLHHRQLWFLQYRCWQIISLDWFLKIIHQCSHPGWTQWCTKGCNGHNRDATPEEMKRMEKYCWQSHAGLCSRSFHWFDIYTGHLY